MAAPVPESVKVFPVATSPTTTAEVLPTIPAMVTFASISKVSLVPAVPIILPVKV